MTLAPNFPTLNANGCSVGGNGIKAALASLRNKRLGQRTINKLPTAHTRTIHKMKNKMLKSVVTALAVTGMFAAMTTVQASDTDGQTLTFEVAPINELVLTAETASVTVDAAVAGSAPTSATSADAGTYSITTNQTGRKITAAIDTDMPAGVTLTVTLASTGGTSAGAVTLTVAEAGDVVTGISTLNESAQAITYGLTATSAAGVVAPDTTIVTFTITAAGV